MHGREETPSRGGLALLAYAEYRRLWMVGGLANAMRWLELVATGLYVLDTTGDALAVALVSAARSLPMLVFGPAAGALADALDRKRLLLAGLAVTTVAAAIVAALAAAGALTALDLALAGFASGLLAAGELSVRRRMVAESAQGASVSQAIAFDSVTNAATRAAGPVLGGVVYALAGATGAYALSAVLNALALALASGVRHAAVRRPLRLGAVARTIGETWRIARLIPAVRAILIVTVAMNCFGFSYAALLAPVGRASFGASDAAIGLLAAAEPTGAILGATLLARRLAPAGIGLFLGGAAGFLALVAVMPHAPSYAVALGLLAVSGLGSAAFATVQSALVLEAAPPEARSRLMGLVTMAIGTGPPGMMLAGGLAALVGAPWAVSLLALAGGVVVATVAVRRGR